MRIEKEIPEGYARGINHKTILNIVVSSNWLVEKIKQILDPLDITPQQYNILRILKNSDVPLSTLKIREQMLDKMSDTSRIVERLLKKQLVNKQVCTYDKRLVDVTISEKGVQLLQRLEPIAEEIDSSINKLTPEEVETLNMLLDKLRDTE